MTDADADADVEPNRNRTGNPIPRRGTDKIVRFADGRAIRLTQGEYRAVQTWIEANGRTGYLYPPRDAHCNVTMTTRLVELGILAWVRPGTLRWMPGVLELRDPIDLDPFAAGRAAEPTIGQMCRVNEPRSTRT